MTYRTPLSPRRSWKTLLGGLVSAMLLIPVPAYATLTWTTPWTVNMGGIGGTPWTETDTANTGPSGNSDFLYITAQSNSTALGAAATITFSDTFKKTAGPNPSDSITPVFTGLNNLTMTAGNVTWQVNINSVDQYAAGNQFFSPNSGPIGPQTGSGTTVSTNTTYNVTVTFTFAAGSTWTAGTVSSSSFTVNFNGT